MSPVQQDLTFSTEKRNLICCNFFLKPDLSYRPYSGGQCGLIPDFCYLFPVSGIMHSDNLDFTDCNQELNTKVTDLTSSATGCSPNFQIRFRLSCDSSRKVIAATLFSNEEIQIRKTDFLPKRTASIDFNLQQLLCKEKALKTIDEQIKDWPVWPGGLQQLAEFFWTKARDAVESLPAHHDTVCIGFDTIVTHIHRCAYKHVPGDCSICLAEFDKLSHVYCLGCSHQFHRDCLSKWVTKSFKNQTCPLCRSTIFNVWS